MWNCPCCDEKHQSVFDTCWKCGSNRTGEVDPEFRISESVREQDQAIATITSGTELPSLQLPVLTYFSIPPVLCLGLILQFNKIQQLRNNQIPEIALSPFEIVMVCALFILVLVPISFTMCRQALTIFRTRRFDPSNIFSEYLFFLSMFRLPESIGKSHRWFVPVYYGSFIAIMFAPIGAAAWLLTR